MNMCTHLKADGAIAIYVKQSEHLVNEYLGIPPWHGVHVQKVLLV